MHLSNGHANLIYHAQPKIVFNLRIISKHISETRNICVNYKSYGHAILGCDLTATLDVRDGKIVVFLQWGCYGAFSLS